MKPALQLSMSASAEKEKLFLRRPQGNGSTGIGCSLTVAALIEQPEVQQLLVGKMNDAIMRWRRQGVVPAGLFVRPWFRDR